MHNQHTTQTQQQMLKNAHLGGSLLSDLSDMALGGS
jgi:hypothetical protein